MKKFVIISITLTIVACSSTNISTFMDKPQQPKVHIGYYLKTADNLLTEKMDKIHEGNNMTRAEWQILNAIAETPDLQKHTLLQTVKVFTSEEMSSQLLDNLIRRNWVENPEQLRLTQTGKEVYAKSLQLQKEFRIKTMNGISQEEYQNVISTLDKMIHNLQQL